MARRNTLEKVVQDVEGVGAAAHRARLRPSVHLRAAVAAEGRVNAALQALPLSGKCHLWLGPAALPAILFWPLRHDV